MKAAATVFQDLRAIFGPEIGALWHYERDTLVMIIHDRTGMGVSFKFQDMPKLAEAFGTEHLNFRSIAGKDHIDSYTFDGSLLIIEARD